MKHRLLHILFIGAVFLSLTACIRDEENTELCRNEKVQVVFTLALDNKAQTRAPGDWTPGDYDPSELGDGYENHIEPGSLQVALYNMDNTFLTHVENLSYYQTGQINVYRFVGEVQVDKLQNNNLSCKVMVLANVANTLDDAANLSEFTFTRANTYIPLWGVKTVNTALTLDTYTDLGVIYLLRAIAKVEVILSDEVAAYTLDNVSFDRYNDSGYCLPTGYNITANTENLSVEGCLRIPTQTAVSTPLAFRKDENNARRFFIYVPEFLNVGVADDAQSSLTVVLQPANTEEEGKTYTIRFAEYGDDGKPTANALNIVRNHLYRFHITNVTVDIESGKIKTDIYTSVKLWNFVDLTPGYE